MKRGRLIFIIDSAFPYQSGGRETWLSEMTGRLSDDFHVVVISMRNFTARGEPLHDISEEVRIHAIPTLLNVRIGGRFAAFKQLFGGLLTFSVIAAFLLLLRYSFPRIPTYVFTMNPGYAFLPALAIRGRKISRIACVRGPYLKEMQRLFPGARRFIRIARGLQDIAFARADLILTNGEDTADAISDKVPDKGRIVALPNGVDFEKFSRAPGGGSSETSVVGMVCTLSPERGTDAVISAVGVLKKRSGISFRLELVGKGDIEKYTNLARELGVDDVVSFQGETSVVDKVLAGMDITLALSDGWGVSHSLLEEMAAGKAVIVLDTPAYGQVVTDAMSGLLVPDREPETLANAMERLITDDALADRVKLGARECAAEYDWSVVERRFRGILSQLLDQRKHVRG